MSELATIGFDNNAFRDNLRQWKRRDDDRPLDGFSRPVAVQPAPVEQTPVVVAPLDIQLLENTVVLPVPKPAMGYSPRFAWPRSYAKLRLSLLIAAGIIFVGGAAVSVRQLNANHQAVAKASATLSQGGVGDPSTVAPSANDISSYSVAPDLARYLNIPELGVHARVLQVGVTKTGALGTPANVFDTAWYKGSAKPGQPGATVIDAHVSSWTTHGVFYGIKNLQPGDDIQIVKGDDTVVKYEVVRTAVYDADSVDMHSAVAPVTAGKSGLNLITCTGKVIKGTNDFSQRLVVFASQV